MGLEYCGIYNIFKSVYLCCGFDLLNIFIYLGCVGLVVFMVEVGINGFEI